LIILMLWLFALLMPAIGEAKSKPSHQIGSRFKMWRKAHGISLNEMSALTGYSVTMICRVEAGSREFSPLAKVHIARSLRVRVEDLFEPTPREPAA
jgi:transcriptional regulator with XRE-family HTH domain